MAEPPPAQRERRGTYDAFISYSHAVDGLRCARDVRRGLVRLMRPWYRRHPGLEIYLDQTSLPAGGGLWPSLEEALGASDHLVLLASPEAARSQYVRQEVGHWRRGREPGTLLIALTRGEIRWDKQSQDFDWDHTDALPREELEGFFPAEPTWVDLRPAALGSRMTPRNERFRTALSSLAAPLYGMDKAAIVRVDERQRRKSIRLAATVLSVLLAMVMVTAGVAAWQWQEAEEQRTEAEEQQAEAEEQARRSLSRQLAAQSGALVGTSPDLASLLAVEAYQVSPTPEAAANLFGVSGLPLDHRVELQSGFTISAGTGVEPLALNRVVVSHDGRMLVDDSTAEDQGRITVRSSADGDVLNSFPVDFEAGEVKHDGRRFVFAFDPTDRYLAVGNSGSSGMFTVDIWDVHTGKHRRTLTKVPDEEPTQLVFSADGSSLAGGNLSGVVRMWDTETGKTVSKFSGYSHLGNLMAISRDHRSVAMSSSKGEVSVWRMPYGDQRRQLVGSEGPSVAAVAFSRDGDTLATGHKDGSVRLWRMPDGKLVRTLAGHRSTHIRTLAFSPDGDLLAVGNNDGTVLLLDAASGRTLASVSDREQTQGCWVSFGADDTLLINTSRNLRSYDLSGVRPRTVLHEEAGEVVATVFSGDGRGLLSVSDEFGTVLWPAERRGAGGRWEWGGSREARERAVQSSAPGWNSYLVAPAFRDGERPLAVMGTGTRTAVVDVRTGKPVSTIPVGLEDGDSVTLSADGSSFAAGQDGRVRVWSTGSGELLMDRKPKDEGTQGETILLSQDGETLADFGGSSDGTRLWDVGTGKHRGTLPDGTGSPIGFSPDGRTLAASLEPHSTEADGSVHLWDVPSRKVRATLVGHTTYVNVAAFSRDRRTVVTAGEDGTVRLWDARSGSLRTTLITPDGAPTALALSPDGGTLAVGTREGGLQLWDVPLSTPEAAMRRICSGVDRGLTDQERSAYLPRGSGGGSGCAAVSGANH